ncbi:GNAT family N-acetyltransferase, partial [Rothia sp. AR01]
GGPMPGPRSPGDSAADAPRREGARTPDAPDAREADVARYEAAYDVVARDRSHYLAVVRDERGRVAGTMQLTIIPGLTRDGSSRLHIEGLATAEPEEALGLGAVMLRWAQDHGRARGATLAQVSAEPSGSDRAFYEGQGYSPGREVLTLDL